MNISDGARAFAGVEQWLVLLCWCAANATSVDLGCNASAKRGYFIANTRTIVNGAAGDHRRILGVEVVGRTLREKQLRVGALTNHTLIQTSANSLPPPAG